MSIRQLAASAALITLACGAAAHAQEATPIRWGVSGPAASLSHIIAPMLYLDKEIQARHGIAMEMIDFSGNTTACFAAVLAQTADVCQNGITVGINAIAQGGDFVGFMQQIGQINEITISATTLERLGIAVDAPAAERIAALKGLRIAGPGPGTSTYYILDEILKEAGLSVADVEFQPLVDLAAINASLANDRIDAAIWSVGGLSPSQQDGSGLRFVSLSNGDVPSLQSLPNVAVYADRTWAHENIDTLSRVRAAFVDTLAALRADPIGYSQAFKDTYNAELSAETWADNLPQSMAALIDDMQGDKAGWDFWVSMLDADSDVDYAPVYYDNAFLELP